MRTLTPPSRSPAHDFFAKVQIRSVCAGNGDVGEDGALRPDEPAAGLVERDHVRFGCEHWEAPGELGAIKDLVGQIPDLGAADGASDDRGCRGADHEATGERDDAGVVGGKVFHSS